MTRLTAAALIALAAAAGTAAHADTIYETSSPFGGMLGVYGPDVFEGQSVGARFTPATSATLTSIGIWFMSNDWEGTVPQTVTVTLRTDVFVGLNEEGVPITIPGETILESWTTDLTVVGWNPEITTFDSETHAALAAGQNYWVVAESPVQGGMSPVWCVASESSGYGANTNGPGAPWQSGGQGAVAMVVNGTTSTPACPADIGVAGGGPGYDGLLDNNDFIAFITYFFDQDAAADMGVAGGEPGQDGLFDNNDFIAFITHFFDGCQ